ncbi:MAG: aspartate-semialdehyde dehydrogenase [Candidatus Thermoplasmatota archaeon]
MKKIPVGLLGCTGLVGQRFVQLLDEHPYFELEFLVASERSAYKKYSSLGRWLLEIPIPEKFRDTEVKNLEDVEKSKIEILFSALPPEIAKVMELKYAKKGFKIFSNASAFRMHYQVPILVPEVNPEHLELVKFQKTKGFIITNPNCTTTGLVLGLKPLIEFGIKNIVVSTYQALSGAGYPGVASLDILGNVIPFIEKEEEKVEEESKKILGDLNRSARKILSAELEITASCARVPVRDGHLESVVVELEKDFELEDIKQKFSEFEAQPQQMKLPTAPQKPIIVLDSELRPQPALDSYAGFPKRAKGMAVSIGRLKKAGKKLRFFLLVHNTIRGAAGCSLLNAELALKEEYL